MERTTPDSHGHNQPDILTHTSQPTTTPAGSTRSWRHNLARYYGLPGIVAIVAMIGGIGYVIVRQSSRVLHSVPLDNCLEAVGSNPASLARCSKFTDTFAIANYLVVAAVLVIIALKAMAYIVLLSDSYRSGEDANSFRLSSRQAGLQRALSWSATLMTLICLPAPTLVLLPGGYGTTGSLIRLLSAPFA